MSASSAHRRKSRKQLRESQQSDMKKFTNLTPTRAALLVDKNSRTIVKMSQLLAIYNRAGASELDEGNLVANRIEKYKQRIARRLGKLAKFADTPENMRPRERAPLLTLPKKKSSNSRHRRRPAPRVSSQSSRQTAVSSQSSPPPPRYSSTTAHSGSTMGMTVESEKQYAFGWKRYVDFCKSRNFDPMARKKSDSENVPAAQVILFAKHLMENSEKPVKPAAANSYVSAVGKKLVDANVVESMRDIRTPEMRDLFISAFGASRQQQKPLSAERPVEIKPHFNVKDKKNDSHEVLSNSKSVVNDSELSEVNGKHDDVNETEKSNTNQGNSSINASDSSGKNPAGS